MTTHESLYRQARYYDIAFSFRDEPRECDFLLEAFRRQTGRECESFLELGAGPGRHAREMARRGLASAVLDSEPAMVRYALDRSRDDGLALTGHVADMTGFELPERYDLAVLLMDSASYLLDGETVLRHLACVADHLTEGGLYILEMSHPRSVIGGERSTVNRWTLEEDDVLVNMRWGEPEDPFDPITQITRVTSTLTYEDGDERGTLVDQAPQRCFTATEWEALVRASGRFELAERYGSLDSEIPFDNRRPAWRMVPVLRRAT